MKITESQLKKVIQRIVSEQMDPLMEPGVPPAPMSTGSGPVLTLKVTQASAGYIAQYKSSLGYGGHINKYADQSGGFQPTEQAAIDSTVRAMKKMALKVQADIAKRQSEIDDLNKLLAEIQSNNVKKV